MGLQTQRQVTSSARQVIGTTSVATLATGSSSGTAGAATSATSLAKPTGAVNWTSNDLVGKFLKVTGGGGYSADAPTLRPILSNTTSAAAVNEVVGMDSTTTFQVVELEPMFAGDDGITLHDLQTPIEFYGLSFGSELTSNLAELVDCARVKFSGCSFDANTSGPSVSALRVARLVIEHCRFTASSDADITDCAGVELTGVVNSAGGAISVTNALTCAVTALSAASAPSSVLRLTRVHSASLAGVCSSGGATPIYLENVDNCVAIVTGTGNTNYGVEINGAGDYVLTGSTVTGGTGDVLFHGAAVTWATLSGSDYGGTEGPGARGTANASGSTKSIRYGNLLFNGSVDVSGRLLLYGYLNQSANLSPVTLTGTDSYNMGAQGVLGFLECICNSATAEVLLPSGAAIPGVVVGVLNRGGSQTLTVKPPAGGTINGGASTTIASNASKTFVSLAGNGGKDFWVLS